MDTNRSITRVTWVFAASLLLTFASVPLCNAAEQKQVFASPDLPNLPYAAAVRAGNMIYVSGVTGHVRGGSAPVAGGIGAETTQSLTYIKEALQRAGSSLDRTVKCTVLLADVNDFGAMNSVFRKFFAKSPPARSTIIVAALPMKAQVEIECVALAGN